ncbi:MAG: hypothetical protein U1A78_31590 [Polyangia bacterium]
MTLRISALMFAMGLAACGNNTSSGTDMGGSTGDMATQGAADMTQTGDMTMAPPKLTVPAGCDTTQAETAANLNTLVQAKCYGGTCHNNGSLPSMKSAAELLALKNKSSSSSLPYVTPNDIDKSYLLYKLTGEQLKVPNGNGSKMPQTGSLLDSEVCRFVRWVKNGAN